MSKNIYGILCINRGMWGGMRSWMKADGEIVTYNSLEKAQIEVDRIISRRGRINNFTDYFAEDASGVLYRVVYTRHNDETILTCKETLEEAIEAAKEYRKEYQVGFITVEKGKGDETKILYGH